MRFAHPWVLLALAVPLILLAWQWRRHGQVVVLPFDFGSQRPRRWLGRLISMLHAAPALLLALAIVLLAGPQRLGQPRTKRSLTNIQFCVDVSGSMLASFGEGTQYDAAMDSLIEFLDYREGDAFGLTVFGDHFLHWVPLTSDVSAFRCAPPFLHPRRLPQWFGQGTQIGRVLREALKALAARKEGDRMIILLSDGFSADLGNGQDEEVARELREQDVQVFAVHIGNSAPPDQLYTITSRTGGEVFAAGDPQALKVIFRQIDTMKATRLERYGAEVIDDFVPWCLAGLALLGLQGASLLGLRYTPW